MTLTLPMPRSKPRRQLGRVTVNVILALTGLLLALAYVLITGIPEDWRGQGRAACLFKDASGAMKMECRP